MAVTELKTKEEFDAALEKGDNESKLMFVDFSAKWCRPCAMIGPKFEEMAKELEGKAFFYKVWFGV